jgi:hypothetical protein
MKNRSPMCLPMVFVGPLFLFLVSSSVAGDFILRLAAASAPPVVVQMSYYAQPGKASDVLGIRLRASAVLARNGVTGGRIIARIDSPRATNNENDPDVVWEGEFTDAESLRHYEEVADANPEFRAARRAMSTLTRRTERRYYEVR